jgi:hypothetical protein
LLKVAGFDGAPAGSSRWLAEKKKGKRGEELAARGRRCGVGWWLGFTAEDKREGRRVREQVGRTTGSRHRRARVAILADGEEKLKGKEAEAVWVGGLARAREEKWAARWRKGSRPPGERERWAREEGRGQEEREPKEKEKFC